jgi:hypothetical protein
MALYDVDIESVVFGYGIIVDMSPLEKIRCVFFEEEDSIWGHFMNCGPRDEWDVMIPGYIFGPVGDTEDRTDHSYFIGYGHEFTEPFCMKGFDHPSAEEVKRVIQDHLKAFQTDFPDFPTDLFDGEPQITIASLICPRP